MNKKGGIMGLLTAISIIFLGVILLLLPIPQFKSLGYFCIGVGVIWMIGYFVSLRSK